jgi:hypothetical protein
MRAMEEPVQLYVLLALISQSSVQLYRAHYVIDSSSNTQWVPTIALIIASIARDDEQVSILENCKDHSAEKVRNSVLMLPCAVP